MKTTMMKIGLLLLAIGIAAGLCSFKAQDTTPELKTVMGAPDTDWSEWTKVNNYVREKICKPISEKDKNNGLKVKNFSRCPSGYQPNIAGKTEEVKTDLYVTGKINYYNGCSPKCVCDFKVCVAKDEAFVKKDNGDYVAVNDWLKDKDVVVVKN